MMLVVVVDPATNFAGLLHSCRYNVVVVVAVMIVVSLRRRLFAIIVVRVD